MSDPRSDRVSRTRPRPSRRRRGTRAGTNPAQKRRTSRALPSVRSRPRLGPRRDRTSQNNPLSHTNYRPSAAEYARSCTRARRYHDASRTGGGAHDATGRGASSRTTPLAGSLTPLTAHLDTAGPRRPRIGAPGSGWHQARPILRRRGSGGGLQSASHENGRLTSIWASRLGRSSSASAP